jgi:hypothetical protein
MAFILTHSLRFIVENTHTTHQPSPKRLNDDVQENVAKNFSIAFLVDEKHLWILHTSIMSLHEHRKDFSFVC